MLATVGKAARSACLHRGTFDRSEPITRDKSPSVYRMRVDHAPSVQSSSLDGGLGRQTALGGIFGTTSDNWRLCHEIDRSNSPRSQPWALLQASQRIPVYESEAIGNKSQLRRQTSLSHNAVFTAVIGKNSVIWGITADPPRQCPTNPRDQCTRQSGRV